MNPPEQLPLPRKKSGRHRIKDRFFLNYCTLGHTLLFWHWRDRKRLIDWMALYDISLPLAQNGTSTCGKRSGAIWIQRAGDSRVFSLDRPICRGIAW